MSIEAGSERAFRVGEASIQILDSSADAGRAAATQAALLINEAIEQQGKVRIIGATGNSQIPFVEALTREPLNWNAVELFHMDEYVDLPETHPASFRLWIRTRFENAVHPGKVHYLNGSAPDMAAEIARYSELLNQAPIDLAFVGFGENGHIAFNDPPVADFNDKQTVKIVTLDAACRKQQAGEGHFPDEASVPQQAVTVTCPGLFRAKSWISMVPDERKSEAVRNALEGPISESCPASLVRRHPNTFVFLDRHSASRLSTSQSQSKG